MFFFRNKHMMCDFGTGNNNKLNWVLEDKQELIDIIETIYRGAKKGRGLVVSPKGELEWYHVPGEKLIVCRLLDQIPILDILFDQYYGSWDLDVRSAWHTNLAAGRLHGRYG